MIKGVETIELDKDVKYGVAEIYGDVHIQLLGAADINGDDINNGCYVSELGYYGREFQLTYSEIATIEKLSKALVADNKYYTYTLDLVKGKLIKS